MSSSTGDWDTSPTRLREIKIFGVPTAELLTITRSGNRATSIAICGRTLTLADVSQLGKACLDVLSAQDTGV